MCKKEWLCRIFLFLLTFDSAKQCFVKERDNIFFCEKYITLRFFLIYWNLKLSHKWGQQKRKAVLAGYSQQWTWNLN